MDGSCCLSAKNRRVRFAGVARGRRSVKGCTFHRSTPQPGWLCQGCSQRHLGGDVCPGVQQPGVRGYSSPVWVIKDRADGLTRPGCHADQGPEPTSPRHRRVTPHTSSSGNRIANTLLGRAAAGSNFCQPLPPNLQKLKKEGRVTRKSEAPRWPMPRLLSGREYAEDERVPFVAWTTPAMDLAWKGVVTTSVFGFYVLLWLRPTSPHRTVYRLIRSLWSGLPCVQTQNDRKAIACSVITHALHQRSFPIFYLYPTVTITCKPCRGAMGQDLEVMVQRAEVMHTLRKARNVVTCISLSWV